eukprot:214714_1
MTYTPKINNISIIIHKSSSEYSIKFSIIFDMIILITWYNENKMTLFWISNKACIGYKLTSSDSIECSGSVSCKRGVESIEGGGFNSLSFAEMDSENTTSMTIKLAETSGKESTILARSDSTVTLEC